MGILRADRVSGLGGANAITGSTFFSTEKQFLSFDGSDINFDTGDFTVEAYVFHIGGADDTIISDVNGWSFTYGASGNLRFYMATGSNAVDATSSFISNEWVHVAVVRSSGTLTFYQNGTAVGSHSYSHQIANNSGTTYIGKYHSGDVQNFIGHISNLRVIQGTALYTGAFTPPTSRLEKTSDTVLLTCNSASNVLNEETGKSLMNENPNYPQADQPGPVASRFAPDKGEDYGTTFADNTKFDTLSYMVPPGGTTAESNRGRAVLAGGNTTVSPANGTKTIEYLQIQSGGIVKDFGDLSEDRKYSAGLASGTRGVIGGSDGTPSWSTGTMEYVTIATTSNTTSFGNMTNTAGMVSAHSNNTRGLFFSVWDSSPSSASHKRHIDYITIATAANSEDFGELTVQRPEAGGFGSSTRAICAGGYDALSPFNANGTIDYVEIATLSNAIDFGDLIVARQSPGSASSSTRGIIAGGYVGPNSYTNHIDYVTIATLASQADFGDMVTGKSGMFVGNCSNQINGVFAGGSTANNVYTNTIEYVTIATTGNAKDFGDLTSITNFGSALTDCHGGIS